MKWILTYSYPNSKNVKIPEEFDVPHAVTFKNVRRWWRRSEYSHLKLIGGVKIM